MREYTFDNFIEDKSNRAAVSICRAFITNCRINPLWVVGNTGCGKTHLLYAIMNDIKDRTDFGTKYIDARDLIEILHLHLKGKSDYWKFLGDTDFLFIDDLDVMKDRKTTQEEIGLFVRDRFLRGKKTVLASGGDFTLGLDYLVQKLRPLDTSLWTYVSKPVFRTRLSYAKAQAEKLGVEVSRNALEYIAHNTDTLPPIKGILKTAEFCQRIKGDEINVSWMKSSPKLFNKEKKL